MQGSFYIELECQFINRVRSMITHFEGDADRLLSAFHLSMTHSPPKDGPAIILLWDDNLKSFQDMDYEMIQTPEPGCTYYYMRVIYSQGRPIKFGKVIKTRSIPHLSKLLRGRFVVLFRYKTIEPQIIENSGTIFDLATMLNTGWDLLVKLQGEWIFYETQPQLVWVAHCLRRVASAYLDAYIENRDRAFPWLAPSTDAHKSPFLARVQQAVIDAGYDPQRALLQAFSQPTQNDVVGVI